MALRLRRRQKAPAAVLPELVIISHGDHAFIFSGFDGRTYTSLRVLDAFGSDVGVTFDGAAA